MINISTITNISRIKKCARGTILTGNGASDVACDGAIAGTILFVILRGEAGVYTNYGQPDADMIQVLGAGDLFADPGLLLDKKAAYTTVALGDVVILPIARYAVLDFMREEPAMAFEIMRELCLRLEHADAAYKALIIQHDAERRPAAPRTGTKKAPPDAGAGPACHPTRSDEEILEVKKILFPPEHGAYTLPPGRMDPACMMKKTYTCPICQSCFSTYAVRPSKLVTASTDSDLRVRYRGIEPLYYEVVTCPRCLYSALPDVFNMPDKAVQDIKMALEPFRGAARISEGPEKDAESVFTGYYLALFCAPVCFTKYQPVSAKLLYKLSRVYSDVGDDTMENAAASQALDNYMYAYARIGISPSQELQVSVVIGELYLKQRDLKNALAFFNRARSCSIGNPALKNLAEKRVTEIRSVLEGRK